MQRKVITVLLTLFAVILVDQVTKIIAVANLKSAVPMSFLNDIFRLQYAENRGAFLSLGAILPEQIRFWVFTILAAVVLFAILLYAIFGSENEWKHTVTYGFIVAGGVGNLIDRIFNEGAVVDFMNIGFAGIRTGIFNVADMAITGGVIALVWFSFVGRSSSEEEVRPDGYISTNQPNSDIT